MIKKIILKHIRYFRNRLHIIFGVRSKVDFHSSLILGKSSYINAPCALTIGKDVSIGAFCFIACDGCIGHGTLISSYVGICGDVLP